MNILYTVICIVVVLLTGYVIGSIPTALIFSKAKGIDVRNYGSHNAGGTNVGRVIGKKEGIMVMIIDIFKCFIPCLVVKLIFTYASFDLITYEHLDELMVSLMGIAVSFGHSFTCFAQFKGGKAVACYAGYVLFSSPILFVLGASCFFLVLKLKKRVSLASVIAAPSVLLLSFVPMILDLTVLKDVSLYNGGMYFAPSFLLHLSYLTTITNFIIVSLIVIRHRTNIKRLKDGTEPETHFKHSGDNVNSESQEKTSA